MSTEAAEKRRTLAILTTVMAFVSIDQGAVSIVLQDIKHSLALSDTQLGLMTGIAFAAFYSVLGIPIGYLADRGDRSKIIAVATGLYGLAVALCGLTRNFAQLLLVRVGVAVGESGTFPAANSLISDLFDPSERGKAMSQFIIGAPLSAIFSYFAVGWLNVRIGWRATFELMGLPGLILAALVYFAASEPRRAGTPRVDGSVPPPLAPKLGQSTRVLLSNRTYRQILLGFSALSFVGGAISQWQPSYLIRSFGERTDSIGFMFLLIFGIGGAVGVYASGWYCKGFARSSEERELLGVAIACLLVGVLDVLVFLAPNATLAYLALFPMALAVSFVSSPLFASLQEILPEDLRATGISVLYLFSNLIGMGLGPMALGSLSDRLEQTYHAESLRYALLLMSAGYIVCFWSFLRASSSRKAASASARPEAAAAETSIVAIARKPSTDGKPIPLEPPPQPPATKKA